MPEVARLGDTHKGICSHGVPCCPHNVTGVISEASATDFANEKGIARLGDAVIHDCPHCGTGKITSASIKNFVNGIGVARLGDTVTYPGGSGTIVSASNNVFMS